MEQRIAPSRNIITRDLTPGSLLRIANRNIRAFFQTKLPNQLGLPDLLALLAFKGEMPRHVAIIGMVPHRLEQGLRLSEPVAGALQILVDELAALGAIPIPRQAARVGHWRRQAELETAVAHTPSPSGH